MNPHSDPSSNKSPLTADCNEKINSPATPGTSEPTVADYIYRIAAVTAGIFLLATLV